MPHGLPIDPGKRQAPCRLFYANPNPSIRSSSGPSQTRRAARNCGTSAQGFSLSLRVCAPHRDKRNACMTLWPKSYHRRKTRKMATSDRWGLCAHRNTSPYVPLNSEGPSRISLFYRAFRIPGCSLVARFIFPPLMPTVRGHLCAQGQQALGVYASKILLALSRAHPCAPLRTQPLSNCA